MGVLPETLGSDARQPVFGCPEILSGRQSRSVGKAKDVRVHGDDRLSEGRVEYHVGGFSTHAGERFERLSVGRDGASMSLNQDGAGAVDVPGLGVEQADGPDVENNPWPLHTLLLAAMGTPIFDSLDLEAVAEYAAAVERWEFAIATAPLRVPGGAGSPLNPIAIF